MTQSVLPHGQATAFNSVPIRFVQVVGVQRLTGEKQNSFWAQEEEVPHVQGVVVAMAPSVEAQVGVLLHRLKEAIQKRPVVVVHSVLPHLQAPSFVAEPSRVMQMHSFWSSDVFCQVSHVLQTKSEICSVKPLYFPESHVLQMVCPI